MFVVMVDHVRHVSDEAKASDSASAMVVRAHRGLLRGASEHIDAGRYQEAILVAQAGAEASSIRGARVRDALGLARAVCSADRGVVLSESHRQSACDCARGFVHDLTVAIPRCDTSGRERGHSRGGTSDPAARVACEGHADSARDGLQSSRRQAGHLSLSRTWNRLEQRLSRSIVLRLIPCGPDRIRPGCRPGRGRIRRSGDC